MGIKNKTFNAVFFSKIEQKICEVKDHGGWHDVVSQCAATASTTAVPWMKKPQESLGFEV